LRRCVAFNNTVSVVGRDQDKWLLSPQYGASWCWRWRICL